MYETWTTEVLRLQKGKHISCRHVNHLAELENVTDAGNYIYNVNEESASLFFKAVYFQANIKIWKACSSYPTIVIALPNLQPTRDISRNPTCGSERDSTSIA
jgi:hypothetical protein